METIKKLRERADRLFSEYIRKRDADSNGFVKCVTCGVIHHWKHLHCGHYISRDKLGVRYDPENCHPQCPACNSAHNENRKEYTVYILKKYKSGTIPGLMRKSMMVISSLDWRDLLNETIKKYSKR